MNDEDAYSVEQLTSFWNSRGVKEECELCGTSNWGIIAGPDDDSTISLPYSTFSGDPYPLALNYTVVMMRCDNCGNVRMHGRDVIAKWKSER